MRKITTFIIYIVFTFGLYLFYSNYSNKIPFSYYDEFWWVNDSYLAQYYFDGDFLHDVWKSRDAIDQPMLTRLVFVATLYPQYINEIRNTQDDRVRNEYTYSRFLISNGFIYSVTNNLLNESYLLVSSGYYKTVDSGYSGYESDFIDKYGESATKPIALIKYLRKTNSLFLALSVVVFFILIKRYKGRLFAFFCALMFAFNPLLVETSLKAHSEALFVFLFTLSLYFIADSSVNLKLSNILVTSILIGFTASSKLNGLLLYPVYVCYTHFVVLLKKIRSNVIESLLNINQKVAPSAVVVFVTFVILNPYTYPNPIVKSLEMYKYRWEISDAQQESHRADSALYSAQQRVHSINENLFVINNSKSVGVTLIIMFIFGIVGEAGRLARRNSFTIFMLSAFVIILTAILCYLKLNWLRYFVPLIPFVVYYEACGAQYILKLLSSRVFKNS